MILGGNYESILGTIFSCSYFSWLRNWFRERLDKPAEPCYNLQRETEQQTGALKWHAVANLSL